MEKKNLTNKYLKEYIAGNIDNLTLALVYDSFTDEEKFEATMCYMSKLQERTNAISRKLGENGWLVSVYKAEKDDKKTIVNITLISKHDNNVSFKCIPTNNYKNTSNNYFSLMEPCPITNKFMIFETKTYLIDTHDYGEITFLNYNEDTNTYQSEKNNSFTLYKETGVSPVKFVERKYSEK